MGRDLFTTFGDDYDVAEMTGDLSQWLKGEFWDITMIVRYVSGTTIAEFVFNSKLFFTASLW